MRQASIFYRTLLVLLNVYRPRENLLHLLILQSRGYHGTVRYGIAVRLDFGKKYENGITYGIFRKSIRYGNTVYFPYRTVHSPYSSNARFALLLPSTALFLLAYTAGAK